MRVSSAVLGLTAAVLAVGCASTPRLSFAVEQRLLRETTLDDLPEGRAEAGDGVVRVVNMGPYGGRCSGALITPRHVLTAAHCVYDTSVRDLGVVDEDEASTPATNEEQLVLSVPGALHIELGGGYLPWGRVGVRHIRACDGYTGDLEHDLAVLVLNKPVPAEVMPFELGYDIPSEAAVFELAGFGTSKKPRAMPDTRWIVVSTNRHELRGPVLLESDNSIYVRVPGRPGDSGGPIVDTSTRRVVSVVSQGRAGDDAPPPSWSSPRATSRPDSMPRVGGPRLYTCKRAIDDALAR